MKAVVYARCSTDEHRQDVENQLRELRRYCQSQDWPYDEVCEYDSAYREGQPKLRGVLEDIRHKRYDVIVVFSLDRFSRQAPSKVNQLLDAIVERDGCRFISRQEGIDSENELIWAVVRPLFSWLAFTYSRNLGEKIRRGIETKRQNGSYRGGRPVKKVDVERLRAVRLAHPEAGWRKLTGFYNEGLPNRQQVSFTLLRRVYQKLSFNGQHENGLN